MYKFSFLRIKNVKGTENVWVQIFRTYPYSAP